MRQQIWSNLCNLKFKTYYMELLFQRYQKRDRSISILIAITSSTSIATWAVWKEVPLLWAGLIALSQVITVVKPYFPFSKYIKELNTKILKAENLNLEFEKLWSKVQRNKLAEDSIDEIFYDLKKQMNEILNFSDEVILPAVPVYQMQANQKVKTFLESNFNVVVNLKK